MNTRVWQWLVLAVLFLGPLSLSVQAQTVGPLANTTVGNARLIVPDGSSVRQSISTGETRWFVFGAEPGKTYVVEAVDPDSDLASDTIGALQVYAGDGTTTPPAETNVDCTASQRAPALEVPVAVDGMRCVVRTFPPSPGNTQNKRGLYVAVGSVTGPSFAVRVRESTIYGRWTTNGYDFHVELENTTGDAMCAQVMFLPNSGNSYAGTWSGAVTTQTLTIPAFGANKLVFPSGTLVGSDNRGTLRIGACSSPVNLMPSGLHVSTYAFNTGINQYLYFFTTTANNGAASNSWNVATGSGGGSLGGGGTAGFLPVWTAPATLGNSLVRQAGGNVGIGGASAPANKLQVGDTPGFASQELALGNGIQVMSFSVTPTGPIWYSNTGFSLQSTIGDANVGIGGPAAAHNLDVYGGNAQIGFSNTANGSTATISKYTNRMEVSPADAFQVSVGGLANPHFWIGSNGNVGTSGSRLSSAR